MSLEQNVFTNFHDLLAPWQPRFSTDQNHFHAHPRYHLNKYTDKEKCPDNWWLCFSSNWNHFRTCPTINTASRVFTRKNATPLGGHVFPPTGTIFELIQDNIGTNHLTKFHDDRTINVASRVLTRKNAPPPGGHVLTNLLTKLHEDRKINVASRVLTRKNAPPPGGHFHEDRTINVASRVKNAPLFGSYVFQVNVTIFELIQDIIETNLLTTFHEYWTINVASRVFTRFYYSHIKSHIRKNAPPLRSHVFQANVTIFELIQDIIQTNFLTKFHEDWTINMASRVLTRKTTPPPGGHVFSLIWTIFALVRDINETNILTKFHDDWAKIVTSIVFTRNTAPSPGGHVF
ncbi:hypothetical protein DPMN_056109 [Dreissena polymorpha]|uniref:Uncharacterized protein n=1 Tax=Dreissena polymorpha TaxID=45954 RepID=A0A9D4CR47_DREPO|nr:hypothetical protein DPMN_056109 [Dreissena polymorpha]